MTNPRKHLAHQILDNLGGLERNSLTELLPDIYDNNCCSLYYETNDFFELSKQLDKFLILSVNAQSLRSKLTYIKSFLHDASACGVNIDCLLIQESWCLEESSDLQIPGYQLLFGTGFHQET